MSSRQSATQVHIAPDTIPCILKCHPLVQAIGMQVIIFVLLFFVSYYIVHFPCVCVCGMSVSPFPFFLSPSLSSFIHTHV